VRIALGVALVLALSGCAASVDAQTVDGVIVLSTSSSSEQRDAVVDGMLRIDKGCLVLVDTAGVPHGLILPAGAAADATAEGIEVTIDGTRYHVHDSVRFSGGFGSTRHADCEYDDYFEPNGVQ